MTPKKSRLALLATLFGSWLLIDSITAISTGNYLSNDPVWFELLQDVGIDPYSFAPAVLSLGVLWLVSAGAIVTRHKWWRGFLGTTAFLSLWYLPFGTFISLVSITVILSGLLPRRKHRSKIIFVSIIASALVTAMLLQVLNLQGAN